MNRRSKRRFSCSAASLALAALFLLNGCGSGGPSGSAPGPGTAAGKRVVVVYTPHGDTAPPAKAAFEAKYPGITVQILDLGGATILPRLRAEKNRPACDVWWGGATGDFRKAEADGLLEPYAPEWTRHLPPEARSATGAWNGMYLSPEAIMFNAEKVKREEVPDTWAGLLDSKWKGRIVVRDVRASATMKTIYGAILYQEWKRSGDENAGFLLLEKLHANTGTYAATPEIMFSLLAAKDSAYALTPWNQFDAMGRKHNHGLPFGFVIPKETPVLVEPIALVRGAPHPEDAKLFYDFVNSHEQLLFAAEKFYRLPARTDLPKGSMPAWTRELAYTPQVIDWNEFDKRIEGWILRWQDEIRSKQP